MDGSRTGSTAEIIGRIGALEALITARRADFDHDRRLPPELFRAMVDADLFRLLAPACFGGWELPLTEQFSVMEAACRLDGSFAWVLTNGAIMSRMAGFRPPEVAQDWFSDRDCFITSSTAAVCTATPARGGYVVTGRWPFGSGIHGARRVMGLVAVDDGTPPPERTVLCAYMPIETVTIHDTWHVSGLRGTGSCDFEANAVFVPQAHTHRFMGTEPRQPGLLYEVPILSAFPLSVTLVALGLAAAAIEAFPMVAGRTRVGTGTPLREREMIQTEIGRADMMYRAARALVHQALIALEHDVQTRAPELPHARAAFRAALSHAGELCERSVAIVAAAAGAAAIREDTPLERIQRDLIAAVKHVAMAPHSLTLHGRMRLGLEPGTVRF